MKVSLHRVMVTSEDWIDVSSSLMSVFVLGQSPHAQTVRSQQMCVVWGPQRQVREITEHPPTPRPAPSCDWLVTRGGEGQSWMCP